MTDKEKAQAYDEALERAGKQKYDYQKEFDKTDKNSQLAEILRAGISAIELVFPELAESEDERIRKALVIMMKVPRKEIFEAQGITKEQALAYLEKPKEPIDPFDTKLFQDGVKEGRRLEREDIKKEPIPIPDKFSGLKSLMLQYLQSAANRKDDTEIESDTDLWGRKILDYVWKYSEKQKEQEHPCDSAQFEEGFKTGRESGLRDGQKYVLNNLDSYGLCKPAEWSEEDEKIRRNLMSLLANMRGDRITEETYQKYYSWLKSLRPTKDCSDCAKHLEGYISGRSAAENKLLEQFGALVTPEGELHIKPRWEPSEEQMQYLLAVINDPNNAGAEPCHLILESLYNDLKKL